MSSLLSAAEYCRQMSEAVARRPDLAYDTDEVRQISGRYVMPRISSADIRSTDRLVLVRAGIHGDEIAGPLTVLNHLGEIADIVHGHGLKLIMYPLDNPSGFEQGIRYNADGDSGVAGNNDCVRYRLFDDRWVDQLDAGAEFSEWRWSDDAALGVALPTETRVRQRRLRREPLSQVVACFDWHQDCALNLPIGTYHYVLGDFTRYRSIVAQVEKLVPVLRNFSATLDPTSDRFAAQRTDGDGNVVRHDGTLTDMFWRLGTPHAITIETTSATPLDVAMRVNLTWLKGVCAIV